jgi:hypothetical protein
MDDAILTLDEAAGLLKVAPETLADLLMSGEVAGRNIGGEWRTTRRALAYFVDGGVGSQAACCPPGMCCGPHAAEGCCASGHC